jgi:hypothetical protein
MPNYIYSSALAKFAKIMLPIKEDTNIPSIGDVISITKADFDKAYNIEDEGSVDNNHNILLLSAILLYPGLIK